MLIVNSRVTSATPPAAQAAHPPRGPRLLKQVAEREGSEVRWDLVQQWTHHVGDAMEPRLPLGKRVGILRRELRHRRMRPSRVITEDRDRAPVGERLVVRTERGHPVPVIAQTEVVDDEGGHQRHDIGVRRHADVRVIGERVAGVDRPTHLVPGLQDDHARASLREVCGGDEAVVAPSDHDRNVCMRNRPSRPVYADLGG